MMSRGSLVIDENLRELIPGLREMNIHLIIPEQGKSDKFIAENLCADRIFVTRNSKDFLKYAKGLSIGIVSLEGIKYIDPETDSDKNRTVNLISDALIKYKAWSRRHGFYLQLRDDGKHRFQSFG